MMRFPFCHGGTSKLICFFSWKIHENPNIWMIWGYPKLAKLAGWLISLGVPP
jgi:hypothetical protein